eukprot:6180914-Pleurochrysis_carterae.AAC.2
MSLVATFICACESATPGCSRRMAVYEAVVLARRGLGQECLVRIVEWISRKPCGDLLVAGACSCVWNARRIGELGAGWFSSESGTESAM